MKRSPNRRLVRSLLVGSSSLALAALAHHNGGGRLELSAPLFTIAIVTHAITWALSNQRWTFAKVAALALVAQSTFHLAASPESMDMSMTMTVAHLFAGFALAFVVARVDRKLFYIATALTARLAQDTPSRCWPRVLEKTLISLALTVKSIFCVFTAPLRGPPMISSNSI